MAALCACAPGKPRRADAGTQPAAEAVTIAVRGRVSSGTGTPIASARVLDGASNLLGTSNSGGDFEAQLMVRQNPLGRRGVLTFEAPGWAPQVVNVPYQDGVLNYRVPVRMEPLTIMPLRDDGVMMPGQLPNGRSVRVMVPQMPGATGGSLRFAGIDPVNGPGELRDQNAGLDQMLQSSGMFYLDIIDALGSPLQMPAAGLTVELSPFTPASVPQSEPEQIFQLNGQGAWEARQPPSDGSTLIRVTRVGFWNVDRNYRTACVRGHLDSSAGACRGARVSSSGPAGVAFNSASAADGSFCLMGAQGNGTTLSAGGAHFSVQMPATAGGCSVPTSCTELAPLIVPTDSCAETERADPCAGKFDCGQGRCVPAASVCNGTPDCPSGADESAQLCENEGACCRATLGCPGETGSDCADTCCCCPDDQACCADRSGCCAAP